MRRVAVDWDGTCVTEAWPQMGEWLPGAVDGLKRLANVYDEVVIFSCRVAPFETDEETPRDNSDQITAIQKMLHNAGMYGNVYVWTRNFKPPADVYLDNLAVRFTGSWDSVLRELDGVPVTEIAWAAGFYDGEGSTVLAKSRNSRHMRALVAQKDRRLLKRFLKIVGVGKIYKPNPSGVSYWQSTNEPDTKYVLSILWPYLGPAKREQAEKVMSKSTWHNGSRDQLLCRDQTHEIVPRKSGGRRCRTCQTIYNKNYSRKNQ